MFLKNSTLDYIYNLLQPITLKTEVIFERQTYWQRKNVQCEKTRIIVDE